MAENNSSAPLKTAEGAALGLPEAGRMALTEYLQECDTHAITPDVGGAWAHAFRAGANYSAQALAAQAPAEVAEPDEREAFEQEFIAEKLRVMGLDEADPAVQAIRMCHLERYGNGDYPSLEAYFAWFAWQARAALAATPALPATEDSSAGDLAEPNRMLKCRDLNDQDMDLIVSWMAQQERGEIGFTVFADKIIQTFARTTQAEVQAEPVTLQMCSELRPRTESEKAAYLAGVADGRMYAERDADTAPQAQPADALDAAFEAVRKRFCKLPRYSILLDSRGNVRRAQDPLGNWVEFEAAHALFDPVAVDAAMAAAQEGGKA